MFLSLCSHPTLFVGIGMKNTGSSVAGWKKENSVENLSILCFPAFEWSTHYLSWVTSKNICRVRETFQRRHFAKHSNTFGERKKRFSSDPLFIILWSFDRSKIFLQGMEERLQYPISARNSARLEKNRDRGISNYETSESVWYKLDNLVPTTTTFGWLDNLQPKTIGNLHQLKAQTQPTLTSSCIDFIATH